MKPLSYSAHKPFGCRFRQASTATAAYAPWALRAWVALAVRRTSDGRLQVARNLLDIEDGFLKHTRFLLLDRDPLYTPQFRALLSSAAVTPSRLPPSSPNLNASAERFVRSIKSECLSKLVLLGENHLRAAVREYLAHYHEERNHQGLAGQLILPPVNLNQPGPIICRERLGGLLRFYHRKAA